MFYFALYLAFCNNQFSTVCVSVTTGLFWGMYIYIYVNVQQNKRQSERKNEKNSMCEVVGGGDVRSLLLIYFLFK